MRDDLLELWQGHEIPTKGILIVSHNIEEAVYMADRVMVFSSDPGQVKAEIKLVTNLLRVQQMRRQRNLPVPGRSQHLVFTGTAAGTLTNATTSCTNYPGQQQLNVHLSGALDNKSLELNIQINGYQAPKTYDVGSLLDGAGEVRLQVGTFDASSTTGAGQVTVNPDGKSGSLNVNLGTDEHVEGTFQCAKVETG